MMTMLYIIPYLPRLVLENYIIVTICDTPHKNEKQNMARGLKWLTPNK
jgi:hypothetical protein